MWCALEESKCQLLYYKSEVDARSKPPAGEINLKGSAITLDLDNQNQFIIMWVCDLFSNAEYKLTLTPQIPVWDLFSNADDKFSLIRIGILTVATDVPMLKPKLPYPK